MVNVLGTKLVIEGQIIIIPSKIIMLNYWACYYHRKTNTWRCKLKCNAVEALGTRHSYKWPALIMTHKTPFELWPWSLVMKSCVFLTQNILIHTSLSYLINLHPSIISTTLTSILCFTSLNIYVCKCGKLTGISTSLLLLKSWTIRNF